MRTPLTALLVYLVIVSVVLGLTALLCSFIGCAHVRPSCDDWCFAQGGSCAYIEHGEVRYNTETGHIESRPTYYNCKFAR